MQELLELLLKRTNHNWDWLNDWMGSSIGYKWDGGIINSIIDCFIQRPKLLTLLVIDLASELWKSSTGGNGKADCYLRIFLFGIPVDQRNEWLLKELK